MPGPPPSRTGDHSRERDANRSGNRIMTKGTLLEVTIPEPDPEWGPEAKMFYQAAYNSGFFEFYQETDWAVIWFLCSEINAYRRKGTDKDGNPYPTHKLQATMFGEIRRAMSELGFTEGDRRRMGVELERPTENETPAGVTAIENYRARLAKKK